jgi:hypothetical protein
MFESVNFGSSTKNRVTENQSMDELESRLAELELKVLDIDQHRSVSEDVNHKVVKQKLVKEANIMSRLEFLQQKYTELETKGFKAMLKKCMCKRFDLVTDRSR